jgi:hypothetical protein
VLEDVLKSTQGKLDPENWVMYDVHKLLVDVCVVSGVCILCVCMYVYVVLCMHVCVCMYDVHKLLVDVCVVIGVCVHCPLVYVCICVCSLCTGMYVCMYVPGMFSYIHKHMYIHWCTKDMHDEQGAAHAHAHAHANFSPPTRNHCHIWQHSQTMSL